MSQSSTSQRLDAARKRTRELEQQIDDIHIALKYIPTKTISALAFLAQEAYQPTRVRQFPQDIYSGPKESKEPNINYLALRELKAWQSQLAKDVERWNEITGDGQ